MIEDPTQRDQDVAAFDALRQDYEADFRSLAEEYALLGEHQQRVEAKGHAAATARMVPSLMRADGFASTAAPFVPHTFVVDPSREAAALALHFPPA